MPYFFRIALFLIISTVLFTHCNSPTDSKSPKQEVSVADVWFSDSEDFDGDGYNSYARLNIDVNVSSGSMDVFLEVGIRVHDPVDTLLYSLYATSPTITIDGSSQDDAVYLGIDDLLQSGFDFLILVYRSSDTENPIAEATPQTHADLGNVPFEIGSTDAGLEIFDVFWVDYVDNDGDGYNSEALMGVDVDVSAGWSSVAYLAIYSKLTSASTYSHITDTDTFTVNGASSGDAVGFRFTNFPHDSYDFLIKAYYFDGIEVEDQVDKNNDSDLGNIWLEPSDEDFLSATLQHHDGSFEDAIWYTSGDFSSQTMFVVGFDKPTNSTFCYIKSISIRISSDAAGIKLRVLGTESNIYTPAMYSYTRTGPNYFPVNVDVSNENKFFVGYLQNVANKPKLSLDTTAPHSGESWWYDGSEWIAETSWDYGISVFIEYAVDSGTSTKSSKMYTKWLPASISSKPGNVNQVAHTAK